MTSNVSWNSCSMKCRSIIWSGCSTGASFRAARRWSSLNCSLPRSCPNSALQRRWLERLASDAVGVTGNPCGSSLVGTCHIVWFAARQRGPTGLDVQPGGDDQESAETASVRAPAKQSRWLAPEVGLLPSLSSLHRRVSSSLVARTILLPLPIKGKRTSDVLVSLVGGARVGGNMSIRFHFGAITLDAELLD